VASLQVASTPARAAAATPTTALPRYDRGPAGSPGEILFHKAYMDARLDPRSQAAFEGSHVQIAAEVSNLYKVNFNKNHVTQVRKGRLPGEITAEGFAAGEKGPPPKPYGNQPSGERKRAAAAMAPSLAQTPAESGQKKKKGKSTAKTKSTKKTRAALRRQPLRAAILAVGS
jgi:hypothetical protein